MPQPLLTVVRSLSDRRVVFTRLCGFRIGAARDGYNPGFSSWLVVLVVLGSFWRLSVDGFCLWRRLFPADSFSVELFLCCCYLCFLRQFALSKYKLSLWQSPRMCDRLPVQVKVYVNVKASFCWLGFFSSNCQY